MPTCLKCRTDFLVKNDDRKFLEEISPVFNKQKYLIPAPTFCPDCRAQRRMSWRNERYFHKRKCDLCQKSILSMYSAEVKFPVYCLDCWWGDKWEAKNYTRDFDFSRPFFEQFFELRDKTPHFSLANLASTMENADYCNHAGYLKNCYLLVNSDESEQCMYGKGVNRCFNCLDSFKIYDCQSCYECINCNNCAFSTFLVDSYTCDSCHFSSNLIGCKSCFGCVNLRNKEYHFLNKPYKKEEYEKKVAEFKKNRSLTELWDQFQDFRNKLPFKAMQEKNTENCSGEYLVNCKNSSNCFDSENLEECRYCNDLKKGEKVSYKNMDISYFGMGVDYSYECSVSGYKANHTLFCENVWECNDIFYSQLCMNNCHDLFGCIGMKHAQYCILNKQYSKEDYEKLVGKIIEHMGGKPSAQREGAASEASDSVSAERSELINKSSFGEFFPSSYSAFPYAETSANEYFPDSKEHLKNRPFKLQDAELKFYKKMDLPSPTLHPDLRHFKRLANRRPRKLYDRNCSNCQNKISSSIAPAENKKVYCEKCYLEAVY